MDRTIIIPKKPITSIILPIVPVIASIIYFSPKTFYRNSSYNYKALNARYLFLFLFYRSKDFFHVCFYAVAKIFKTKFNLPKKIQCYNKPEKQSEIRHIIHFYPFRFCYYQSYPDLYFKMSASAWVKKTHFTHPPWVQFMPQVATKLVPHFFHSTFRFSHI